jgi:hypothetical protein
VFGFQEVESLWCQSGKVNKHPATMWNRDISDVISVTKAVTTCLSKICSC